MYKSILEAIGNTPLVELTGYEKEIGAKCTILAKLEYLNPAGSTKDRVAKAIIENAEKTGELTKDCVIIEPTSGNTGIGLAAVAAAKKYRLIITMPENMSKERIMLMKAYGAQVVLTDATKGMQGAIDKAEELHSQISPSIIAGQFTNPINPLAHKQTTAPEIWKDTNGSIDFFVAGVGTGGTISGVGEYLKQKNNDIKIIAVEPASSPVISGGKKGKHKIQGIGAGFIPSILNTKVIDKVTTVSDEDAYATGRLLPTTDGILAGISSGAAVWAAGELAKCEENRGKTIVVFLPDTGDRYLSTPDFYNE